jgi:hypothetical protein
MIVKQPEYDVNDNEFALSCVSQKNAFLTQIYHFVAIMFPLWHDRMSRLVFISSIKCLIEHVQTG